MATSIDLLVMGDYLYPMSGGLLVVRDGEVAVGDGRVLYAGARQDPGHWRAAQVIGGAGKGVSRFIHYHGRPIGNHKHAWRDTIDLAGLDRRVTG